MGVRVLFALLLAMTVVDYSVAACYKGDTACFCKALGGEFRPLSPPLGPDACRVSYIHQGKSSGMQETLHNAPQKSTVQLSSPQRPNPTAGVTTQHGALAG